VFLADDGLGKLGVYTVSGLQNNLPLKVVGKVDYGNSTLTIENLVVDAIPNNRNFIEIYVMPKNNDVIAYRNQILLLEDQDIEISVTDLNSVRLS
jgi:hypothetical protein